ncbi:MAG: hypothetical protein GXO92_05305 [FCB group bacterium]|nr:hypothetical protein [FCB group bacterium]
MKKSTKPTFNALLLEPFFFERARRSQNQESGIEFQNQQTPGHIPTVATPAPCTSFAKNCLRFNWDSVATGTFTPCKF